MDPFHIFYAFSDILTGDNMYNTEYFFKVESAQYPAHVSCKKKALNVLYVSTKNAVKLTYLQKEPSRLTEK